MIPGTKRNSANQRLFDDMEIEWLFVSITLRSTGLSIKEVQRYIQLYQSGDETIPERYHIMLEQRKKVVAEIEQLKLRLAVIDKKIEHYGRLLNGEADEWSHECMQNLIKKGLDNNE